MRIDFAAARPYLVLCLGLAALTGVLAPFAEAEHTGVVALVFLLATLLAAARWGYGPGLAAGVVANLLLNFFFVTPVHRLTVAEPNHLLELSIFLAVAVVGAFMLSRLRAQAERAKSHQAETEFLLQVAHSVADAGTPRASLNRLCEVAARTVGARGCAVLSGEPLAVVAATVDERSNAVPTRDESAMATRARELGQPAGLQGERPITFVALGGGSGAVLRLLGRVPVEATLSARFEGVVVEIRSALDRLRLNNEALQAEEFRRSDAFKTLLLASASHDLRTPLTAVKAAVSSLRDENVDWSEADRAAFLETIESQADVLSTTLGNLLTVSRLEAGTARAHFEAIEVAPLLEEVDLATRSSTAGREVSRCATPNVWVRADYGLLIEALKNVVENAAKYSTLGGPLRIEAQDEPARVSLRVIDAGPPIPAEDLPLLFEKFFRGRTSRAAKGSGLGLALVKAIVEMANGTVSANSTAAGNEFTLALPRVAPPV